MTTTGASLLTGLSRYLGELDFPGGLTTTGAGSTTTLVDTSLSRFDDDYLVGWYIRITENVNGNQYLYRKITDFVSSTGTCTVSPAFPGATASGTDYEIHRFSPDEKFSALDEARTTVYPAIAVLKQDDTTVGDGHSDTFDIPTSIRRGPVQVWIESPIGTDKEWNLLGGPNGDDTSKWSASSVTAATFSEDSSDLGVPKYTDSDCTKLTVGASTAGTYTQVVASMANGVTAAKAAGRKMTFGAWVYSTAASRIRLGITDDSGTTYGSYHQGLGWEFLTVEDTIVGNNATLLSAAFDIASGTAQTFYWQRGFFYYGTQERVKECYAPVDNGHVRRDNALQQVRLNFIPPRGYTIRMVGRTPLTALGTTASTQVTNTMEVDEFEAELLYSEALKVLLNRGVISSGDISGFAPQLQVNEARLRELKQKWEQPRPAVRVKTLWG